MTFKVLVSAPYFLPVAERYRARLAERGVELVLASVKERLTEDELLPLVGDFDGIICGDDQMTERVYKAAKKLKVLSKWGTGIDSLQPELAKKFGVLIKNTPNAFTLPVADSVMGYLLAFARRQPWMDRAMKAGIWEKIPGRSLSECTLGVIGVGNCGKAVIRRARAFGMRVFGTDVRPIEPDFLAEYRVQMVSLHYLLSHTDFVSLNCDLNPSSRHIINAETIGFMREGAVLINTARGPLVDEHALITALQDGRIGGSALDVFEIEPLPMVSPLHALDNVMLAPHNANSSPYAWEHVHERTLSNLLEALYPLG